MHLKKPAEGFMKGSAAALVPALGLANGAAAGLILAFSGFIAIFCSFVLCYLIGLKNIQEKAAGLIASTAFCGFISGLLWNLDFFYETGILRAGYLGSMAICAAGVSFYMSKSVEDDFNFYVSLLSAAGFFVFALLVGLVSAASDFTSGQRIFLSGCILAIINFSIVRKINEQL